MSFTESVWVGHTSTTISWVKLYPKEKLIPFSFQQATSWGLRHGLVQYQYDANSKPVCFCSPSKILTHYTWVIHDTECMSHKFYFLFTWIILLCYKIPSIILWSSIIDFKSFSSAICRAVCCVPQLPWTSSLDGWKLLPCKLVVYE